MGNEASAADWVRRDEAVVWHGFTQMATFASNSPIVVERGEGRDLIDVDGRRYLDAISSVWMMTLGHHVPELDDAIRDQLDRIAHSTMLGHGNVATIELAEALAPRLPVEDPHLLFASDGAAAVEQAIKIAFQHWVNLGVGGRTSYLAFGGAYHGDTIGSISVGSGGFGTDLFDPLRFGVLRAPGFDDPSCIEVACELIRDHHDALAAVIVEPLVQGAAGIHTRAAGELAALAATCSEHDVLLICDEVAVGFGRTGTLFASQRCGIRPDIMALGKGITGGYLPMSATAVSRRVYDSFLGADLGPRTLYHGHSYAGNALAAAVARRHLELIDQWRVLANVEARSVQLGAALEERIVPLPQVREVRQQGLMVGVELAPPLEGLRWGRRVSAACVERGVLIRPLGDVVVSVPMLTTTSDEVERIVDTLVDAISAAT
ncbi:MAG: adenosylmethionine--8-amino-7-oxononanoate transaminase [Actinobacteria bacterium]|nr:adenosylmethionine--8-amino-7-oxononanoate transaminase [Actinomycetota bacterium]